jgi:hypothetical protein
MRQGARGQAPHNAQPNRCPNMNIDTLKARIQREGYTVDPDAVAEAIISRVVEHDDDDAPQASDPINQPDARTREPRVSYPQRRS